MSDDAELVTLSSAAAHALSKLVPERVARSEEGLRTLQLVAIAISALVSVYARDARSGALGQIGEAELRAGRFSPGAERFVAQSGQELELLVQRTDVQSAIERLVAQYIGLRPHAPSAQPPARRTRAAS